MLPSLWLTKTEIWFAMVLSDYEFDGSVDYHYGKFPPKFIDYGRLLPTISRAATSLGRYDAVLRNLHNSEILLAPLRRREAVISSRMEGTIATLEEVLEYEANVGASSSGLFRHEVIEVYSYSRAMNFAQKYVEDGLPLSGRLIRNVHEKLLFVGRGADKQPGVFKSDQNYVVDTARKRVLFVPVSPEGLQGAFTQFERYINDTTIEPLLQTAIAHAEFEAIHPFKDGNGRIGRMLITLMLWNRKLITAPHFYISANLEAKKDEYIDKLRQVSSEDRWTEWTEFFMKALEVQAEENLSIAEGIQALYEEMKGRFREATSSQWSTVALDFIFNAPVFRNNNFNTASGIPKQTANRITRTLLSERLLRELQPSSGRRSALYVFDPLLEIVRA